MKPAVMSKFLEHPDKDEIISKLAMDIPAQTIHDWLEAKYSAVSGDTKIVIPVANLKEFKATYLDIYKIIKEDVIKTQNNKDLSKEMELSLKNNKTYKQKINELAGKEVDIKQMLSRMIIAMETRAGQVFDIIQENPENLRNDRIAMEWFDHLGNALERYRKIILDTNADNNVQHQHVLTIQLDQHVNVFQNVIKEILAELDVDASMKFMDIFSERMNKLKEAQAAAAPPPNNTELRLAEVTAINNVINNKLQE